MLRCVYTANSGVAVQIDGITILADCLFEDRNPFTPMKEDLKRAFLDENGPFSSADVLLFTHSHNDHYSAELTEKYLENNPSAVLAAPEDVITRQKQVSSGSKSRDAQMVAFGADRSEYVIGGVKITAVEMKHLPGTTLPPAEHMAYAIKGNEGSVFISADAQMDKTFISQIERLGPFDALFINPVPLLKSWSAGALAGLNSRKIWIYHLPEEEFDTYLYRKAAQSGFRRHENLSGKCELLLESMKEI